MLWPERQDFGFSQGICFFFHAKKWSHLLWLLALRLLAFPVEIPDRLGQELGHIWALCLQDIPHVVNRAHITLPSKLRLGKAEQSDKIRVIGMEELTGVLHAAKITLAPGAIWLPEPVPGLAFTSYVPFGISGPCRSGSSPLQGPSRGQEGDYQELADLSFRKPRPVMETLTPCRFGLRGNPGMPLSPYTQWLTCGCPISG